MSGAALSISNDTPGAVVPIPTLSVVVVRYTLVPPSVHPDEVAETQLSNGVESSSRAHDLSEDTDDGAEMVIVFEPLAEASFKTSEPADVEFVTKVVA